MRGWRLWRGHWRPVRVALAAVAIAGAVLTSAWTPAAALECEGVVLDDGCLFTVTGSDTPEPDDGYAVTNAHGAPFYDFIRALDLQPSAIRSASDGPARLSPFKPSRK